MALYLEADRMASFKVSEEIYKIERNVVAKEWGIRHNQPYGTMFEDFLKAGRRGASRGLPGPRMPTCTRLPTATPTAVHIPASRECRRLFLTVMTKLGPGLTMPRVDTTNTVIQSWRNDAIRGSLLWVALRHSLDARGPRASCKEPRIFLRIFMANFREFHFYALG